MIDVERRSMVPEGGQDSFEVVDYAEFKPGMSVLTYKYTSAGISGMRPATTTRWCAWVNDHALASGVLHTDFGKAA